MGILTLLRNAFGRSRKSRATAPEGAIPSPDARQSPSETTTPDEHDLVTAAFDNLKVPHQPTPPDTTPEHPAPAEAHVEEPASAGAETEEKAEEPATAEAEEPAPAEADVEEPTPAEAETGDKAEEAVSAGAEAKVEDKAEQPTTAEEPQPAKADEKPTETNPEPAKTEAQPKPAPAEESTPEAAEPDTEADAEAKAGADTEANADAKTNADAKAKADAEAKAGADAKPEPDAEPEADAKAEPDADAEPEADAEAEAVEATTLPQAADGEDTPQGPPAPDNASRTGGAGGSTDAEGEAEANPTPQAPQADAPQAPAPQATTPAKPATPLTKVKAHAPALATAYKAAAATLKKTDLTGTRAKLYLVLDRSASMRPYYQDGSAQALADQTLALAAHLDPEATVHVVFFSTEVDGTTDLTLAPDHETKIDDVHAGLGRMGRTSYHAAVEAVLAHHEKTAGPAGSPAPAPAPALVVFQTDGAPDARTPATQALSDAAESHPSVFFSFVAFGDHDNKAFDYLRKLKTPNTSFFHAGPTPRELTDAQLYEGVLAAWRP
ncbi:VWA domain-containing protein [Streptomyces capoamus]|uniref:VWA domain-containing protein n=1 Tax=Streptomyces capoamus TaxID=68183 RepID=UPI003C2EE261